MIYVFESQVCLQSWSMPVPQAHKSSTRGVHFSSVSNVFGFGKGLEVIYRLAESHSTS